MMQENKLSINCGAACLIRDSQGMFDQVQALNLKPAGGGPGRILRDPADLRGA